MKTGIYARVSTLEQAKEGYSIRAQVQKLRALALAKDWDVVDVYVDEGLSGKSADNRAQLNRLLEDVESGRVNNVLVYRVDRLTRSTRDLISLMEFFEAHGCAFNSSTESIDTATATGRMFLKILGIFAEFERENLVERVRLGFERKVREGYTLCAGTPSLGYVRGKGEKVQRVDDLERESVVAAFGLFLEEGATLSCVARRLTALGARTKHGGKWCAKTVKLLLQNPNYVGRVRYGMGDAKQYFEAEGRHEPIIDAVTYQAAQAKLAAAPDSGAYFRGVLYCAECGAKLSVKSSPYVGKSGRIVYYGYRCACGRCSASHKKVEIAAFRLWPQLQDIPVECRGEWLKTHHPTINLTLGRNVSLEPKNKEG